MKVILVFIVAAICSIKSSVGQEFPDFLKKCPNGETVRLDDLLKERTPNFSVFTQSNFPNYPYICIIGINKDLTDLKNQWKNEDKQNWSQLSNQFCSHENGWVEYKPGECQAGGPPPICPQNHWYKNPGLARERWKQLQNAVKQERLREVERTK